MRALTALLCSLSLATHVAAEEQAPPKTPPVTTVEVRIDRPLGQEETQLKSYLEDLVGWPANAATAAEAEERVGRLGRYASAVCRTSVNQDRGRLKCGVARARIIRNIRFEGLPAQILETDIRKRLFLRPGEPLSRDDAAGRDRITRQRERLEEYLEREGFYGARVEIRTPPVSRTADVEVVVLVDGGNFLRVRDVDVKSWLPFKRDVVRDEYARMCSGGDGWLALFETWELSCFTRTRVRETTDELEATLRENGYPEGRVVVKHTILDAADPKNGDCAWSQEEQRRLTNERLPVAPRCVDLDVRVIPGRHLVPTVVLHHDDEIERSAPHDAAQGIWRWAAERLRNLTFYEELSRLTQLVAGTSLETAADTTLRLDDIKENLTFAASGAVDETEVEVSRRALLAHLASRGYLGARVESAREATEDRVEVRFDIYPGAPAAVSEVLLIGNARFSDEELRAQVELAAKPRSLTNGGFVTRQDIEDDVQRLFTFYEQRGYRDATVSGRASPQGDDLVVSFYIEEGEPYLLGGTKLRGGEPALTSSVLQEIVHCKGGRATEQKRPPIVPKDCAGAPLRPEELAADSERVRAVYASAGYPYVDARVALSPEWTEEGPILEITVWQPPDAGLEDGARTREPPPPGQEIPRPVRVSRGEIFLEGNFRTERHALLNEMGLPSAPQERLDPLEISAGVSRLRRSGLFSRVDYEYIGREDQRSELDVVVQVEERKAGTVDLAAAFSTQDLGQLRAEWRDRNLFGLMLDFGVRGDYGLFIGRESRVEAPFRYPRILGSNFSLKLEPSAVYTDHPSVVTPRVPSEDDLVKARAVFHSLTRRRIFSVGTRVGVEWVSPPDVIPGLSAGVGYEIRAEWDDPAATRIPLLAPYALGPVELRLPSQRALETLDGLLTVFDQPLSRVGLISPNVRYNSVENPFDPQGGWSGELALSFGHPWLGASQTTVLLSGRGTYYWSFAQNFVLALHGRAWGGVTDVEAGGRSFLLRPDLLSLGGDRTVRGYGPATPFGVTELAAEVAAGDRFGLIPLLGGVGNAEVRWTAVRNLFIGDLKLAAFIDAGFVTSDDPGFRWAGSLYPWLNPDRSLVHLLENDRLGLGIGAGVRYVLPVGPLSLDVAYAPLEQNVQLHLQFGYAF